MTNPFDLYEDTHEDWDKDISVDLDDVEYEALLSKCRSIFERTQEAINYLKRLNKTLLTEAEKRQTVEKLMLEQIEQTDSNKELEKLFVEYKKTLGIRYPKNLEEILVKVQKNLLEIPPKSSESYIDYNSLLNYSHAHYLRKIAKHAWDIQNEIQK